MAVIINRWLGNRYQGMTQCGVCGKKSSVVEIKRIITKENIWICMSCLAAAKQELNLALLNIASKEREK